MASSLDQFWNVCGVPWFLVWCAYWLGLVMFHSSREKAEVYGPVLLQVTLLLAASNFIWFVVRGMADFYE